MLNAFDAEFEEPAETLADAARSDVQPPTHGCHQTGRVYDDGRSGPKNERWLVMDEG